MVLFSTYLSLRSLSFHLVDSKVVAVNLRTADGGQWCISMVF